MREKKQTIKYLSLLFLGLIFFLGLHLRLTTVMESEVVNPIRADAKEYVVYAINLNKYGIYSRSTTGLNNTTPPIPDAARPPGYPLFLALFLDGSNVKDITLTNILMVQACLSALVVLFAYAIFSPLLGKSAAIVIASLIAMSPHLINANIYFLSETLFSVVLILFFWLLGKMGGQDDRPYLAVGLGILLAIASLTRPWLQYFILLLIPLFFYSKDKTHRIKPILLLTLAFFLTMGIWQLRNFNSVGDTSNDSVLISSVLHGMYPNLMYQNNPESYGFPYRYDPNFPEIRRSLSTLLAEIMSRFENQTWAHFKWYLVGKPLNLFSWDYIQGMGDSFIYPVQKSPYFTHNYFQWSHAFMKAIHTAIMSLAILGSIMVWLPQKQHNISFHSLFILRSISLLIGYFILIHILVAPLPRYSVPIRPLMYGLAIFPLLPILNRIGKKTMTTRR